jgi:hypothetical protein
MEHVPNWAKRPAPNGHYYAPQYASDAQWCANTLFSAEQSVSPRGLLQHGSNVAVGSLAGQAVPESEGSSMNAATLRATFTCYAVLKNDLLAELRPAL